MSSLLQAHFFLPDIAGTSGLWQLLVWVPWSGVSPTFPGPLWRVWYGKRDTWMKRGTRKTLACKITNNVSCMILTWLLVSKGGVVKPWNHTMWACTQIGTLKGLGHPRGRKGKELGSDRFPSRQAFLKIPISPNSEPGSRIPQSGLELRKVADGLLALVETVVVVAAPSPLCGCRRVGKGKIDSSHVVSFFFPHLPQFLLSCPATSCPGG